MRSPLDMIASVVASGSTTWPYAHTAHTCRPGRPCRLPAAVDLITRPATIEERVGDNSGNNNGSG